MGLTRKLLRAAVFFFAMMPAVSWAEQREFNMTIDEVTITVAPGFTTNVFAFNGQVPGPLIHIKEGDDVTVHVTNNTSLSHTIHWHGVNQVGTWQSDGVPGVTQKAIEPGDTYTYHWKADRPGTLWYHCHVNVWEHVATRGMWGPLIIDPKKPTTHEKSVTKDVIMMMSTWQSAYANVYGKGGAPTDVSDYFSVNAKSFPLSNPIRVKKGDVLRFRMIGAGDEVHEMHLHGHDQLFSPQGRLRLAESILHGYRSPRPRRALRHHRSDEQPRPVYFPRPCGQPPVHGRHAGRPDHGHRV